MEGFNAVTSYLWLCAHTCAAFYVMLHTIRLRCVHQLVCHLATCFFMKKLTDSARSGVSCHHRTKYKLSGVETLVSMLPTKLCIEQHSTML